jgi:hypothetical protein
MFRAPILYLLRVALTVSFGSNNAINGMAPEAIANRHPLALRLGRLTAPYVTLVHGTMEHPLRHFFSHRLPRAAHV